MTGEGRRAEAEVAFPLHDPRAPGDRRRPQAVQRRPGRHAAWSGAPSPSPPPPGSPARCSSALLLAGALVTPAAPAARHRAARRRDRTGGRAPARRRPRRDRRPEPRVRDHAASACASRSRRGARSSPPRRTSCARRWRRCSVMLDLLDRRPRTPSPPTSQRRAPPGRQRRRARLRGSRSWPASCSTSAASTPASRCAASSVELASRLRSVVAEFEVRAGRGRAARVEVAGDAALWAVGDPGGVAQIVRILLDNALRHTPPGGRVRVRLDAARTSRPACAVARRRRRRGTPRTASGSSSASRGGARDRGRRLRPGPGDRARAGPPDGWRPRARGRTAGRALRPAAAGRPRALTAHRPAVVVVAVPRA